MHSGGYDGHMTDGEPTQERLDEPDPNAPHFYESGTEGEEFDDQEIAPPG
jgi:hypothetical protein